MFSFTRHRALIGRLAFWFDPRAWYIGRYPNGYVCFGPFEWR